MQRHRAPSPFHLCLMLCVASSAACSSHESPVEPATAIDRVEVVRVREPIDELVPGAGGVTYVHFERSSLRYRIDPAASPNAQELLEYATRALADGREVCALVDRSTVPKTKAPPVSAGAGPPLIIGFE